MLKTKQQKTDSVRLRFYWGTSWAHSAAFDYGNSDITVCCDVQDELNKIQPQSGHYEFWPVGSGSTINDLVTRFGTSGQQAAWADRPNITAANGLAGLGMAGLLAARQMYQERHAYITGDFASLLMNKRGVQSGRVITDVLCSTSGGVASQGAAEFMELLATDFTAIFNQVDFNIYLLGGLTFQGPGFHHTRENAAASLVKWLRLSKKRIGNACFSLTLLEALPVGQSVSRRSMLLLQNEQALEAASVRAYAEMTISNDAAARDSFGNVRLADTQRYRSLSLQRIANDVATEYLKPLDQIVDDEVDPLFASEPLIPIQPSPSVSARLDDIMESALKVSPEQLVELASKRQFLVYPRLESQAIEEDLIEQHKVREARDPDSIAFTRTCYGSPTVVRLTLHKAAGLDDIITPTYLRYLSHLLNHSSPELFIDDVRTIEQLGISVMESN